MTRSMIPCSWGDSAVEAGILRERSHEDFLACAGCSEDEWSLAQTEARYILERAQQAEASTPSCVVRAETTRKCQELGLELPKGYEEAWDIRPRRSTATSGAPTTQRLRPTHLRGLRQSQALPAQKCKSRCAKLCSLPSRIRIHRFRFRDRSRQRAVSLLQRPSRRPLCSRRRSAQALWSSSRRQHRTSCSRC